MRSNPKVHPTTGEPVDIVYPPLPPGSLLCFVHWMPHGVTYIDEGVRLGLGRFVALYHRSSTSHQIR